MRSKLAAVNSLDGVSEKTIELAPWSVQSLPEGIGAGNYNDYDQRFGLWYPSAGWELAAGSIELVRFKQMARPELVVQWLSHRDYTSLNLPELLSLGYQFPDEQRRGSIVTLGATASLCHPVLDGYPVWRSLELWFYCLVAGGEEDRGGYPRSCRFAVKRLS